MKTPEEIKKGLEVCVKSDGCKECPYHPERNCKGKNIDALAYIQQLEKMLGESFARNAPALEAAYGLAEKVKQLEAKVPKWISVEERLPDKGEKVLARGVKGGIYAGIFSGTLSVINNGTWSWKNNTCLNVVCWMSQDALPEPPEV